MIPSREFGLRKALPFFVALLYNYVATCTQYTHIPKM